MEDIGTFCSMMTTKLPRLGLGLVFAIAAGAASQQALAHPRFVGQVPNAGVNSCSTCHTSDLTVRNPFGQAIEAGFLIGTHPTESVNWNSALAALDSDGDGRSNGVELQDPSGSWRPGNSNPGSASEVTNPGVSQSSAAPTLPIELWPGLLVGLAGLLYWQRR